MELVQETNCRAMLDELSTLSDYIRAMRTHYKPQMNGERYYTTEDVCQVLKITKRTLQQYRDDGVIPFIALPGKMLYRDPTCVPHWRKTMSPHSPTATPRTSLWSTADDNRLHTLLQNENSRGFSFVVLE